MKGSRGIASKTQRQIRDELLASGVRFWWLARTPRACLLALKLSGVPLVGWKPPKDPLQPWEGPHPNPHARLPQHPDVAMYRAAARKRSRERQREHEAALAAAPDQAGDVDAGGLAPTHWRVDKRGFPQRVSGVTVDRKAAAIASLK